MDFKRKIFMSTSLQKVRLVLQNFSIIEYYATCAKVGHYKKFGELQKYVPRKH